MARINISVPDDLKRRMDELSEPVNWSQVAAEAFAAKIQEATAQEQETRHAQAAQQLRRHLYEDIDAALPPDRRSLAQRGLMDAYATASHYYKPVDQHPFIEVYSFPADGKGLTKAELRDAPRLARVETRHDFPLHFVEGWAGPQLQSDGQVACLPPPEALSPNTSPSYFWTLTPAGAFLERNALWEDKEGSLIRGGVGLMHVSIRTVLLLRFLRRLGITCRWNASRKFVVGVRIACVKDRFLASEFATELFKIPRTQREHVETSGELALDNLQTGSLGIATTLLEDLAWKFERTDLTKKHFVEVIRNARLHVEPACCFPEQEKVQRLPGPEE